MTRLTFLRPLFAISCVLLLLLQAACNSVPAPSEDEIRKTIEVFFAEVYGKNNGGAVFKDLKIEFGSIEVGKTIEKQMGRGEAARSVYPIRVPVKISVSYSNNPTISVYKRGATGDDVFFFYKDGFDKWTFRTGRM